MEIPLLPDAEAATAILRDAEAAEAASQKIITDTYAEFVQVNKQCLDALAVTLAPKF